MPRALLKRNTVLIIYNANRPNSKVCNRSHLGAFLINSRLQTDKKDILLKIAEFPIEVVHLEAFSNV